MILNYGIACLNNHQEPILDDLNKTFEINGLLEIDGIIQDQSLQDQSFVKATLMDFEGEVLCCLSCVLNNGKIKDFIIISPL